MILMLEELTRVLKNARTHHALQLVPECKDHDKHPKLDRFTQSSLEF